MNFNLGEPNLVVFSETLMKLARTEKDLVVVTSDSRGSGKLTPFGGHFPEKIIEVGIAEQNLVGVSSGLAASGKKVYAVSPACFLTTRSFEQIKNDVCYSDQPVKLIGISAGVSYGALGSTHHSLHDFAALRAINNITIVAPSDNFETEKSIVAAINYNKPVYIRFGKKKMYDLNKPDTVFKFGKSIRLREGSDVAIIATGETVYPSLLAANLLEEKGISTRVISMHTVKPLDKAELLNTAKKCDAIITVEEHMITGGLGESCASYLLENNLSVKFKMVGFPDEDTVTGSQIEIFDHYGISPEGLFNSAISLLNKRKPHE